MRITMFDHVAHYQHDREAIDRAVLEVIGSGKLVMGPDVRAFEEEFAAYCGIDYAVAVTSGSSALLLALRALGIGPGDEVITVANSDIPTSQAVTLTGAQVVWVDIETEGCNIDPGLIEAAITPRTRAILPVHLHGVPAERRRWRSEPGLCACDAEGARSHQQAQQQRAHGGSMAALTREDRGRYDARQPRACGEGQPEPHPTDGCRCDHPATREPAQGGQGEDAERDVASLEVRVGPERVQPRAVGSTEGRDEPDREDHGSRPDPDGQRREQPSPVTNDTETRDQERLEQQVPRARPRGVGVHRPEQRGGAPQGQREHGQRDAARGPGIQPSAPLLRDDRQEQRRTHALAGGPRLPRDQLVGDREEAVHRREQRNRRTHGRQEAAHARA